MKWIPLALVAALFLTRLPFFTTSLCGEEGIFAHAVLEVTRGEKPRLLVARDLRGVEYSAVPEHNLAGYVIPGLVFAPFAAVLGTDSHRLDVRVFSGAILRFVFFLIYLAAAVTALMLIKPSRRLMGAALIVLFSLQTLPFFASIQIQYDGAVSSLLLVSFVALLTGAIKMQHQARSSVGMAFGAGALIALGKLEYVIVALGTLGMIYVAALFLRARVRHLHLIPPAFAAGIIAGMSASYIYDPANFIGGFEVLVRASSAVASTENRHWLYFRGAWKRIHVLLFGLIWLGIWVWKYRRNIEPQVLLPGIAAFVVTLGFLVIAWGGDGFPRYFAPAFILLPVALAQIDSRKWMGTTAVGILVIEAIVNYGRFIPNAEAALCRLALHAPNIIEESKVHAMKTFTCVPKTDGSIGFYAANSPFVCCGYWEDPQAPESLRLQQCP